MVTAFAAGLRTALETDMGVFDFFSYETTNDLSLFFIFISPQFTGRRDYFKIFFLCVLPPGRRPYGPYGPEAAIAAVND